MSASVPQPTPDADPVPPLMQRIVAAAGIAFAVLLILTILLSGDESPDRDAALSEWTAYARDNEDNLRISALIFAFAVYEFLLFLGYLRSAIGEAERRARGFVRAGYIVLAGGIVGIAGLGIGVFLSAISITEPDTPPEVLRALNDLSGAGFGLAASGFGAWMITVGVVNAQIRALPSWLGWVALGGGAAFLLQLGILLSEDEDNAFGVFFPIAFLLLVIFTIGASISFLGGIGAPRAAEPAGPAPPPLRTPS